MALRLPAESIVSKVKARQHIVLKSRSQTASRVHQKKKNLYRWALDPLSRIFSSSRSVALRQFGGPLSLAGNDLKVAGSATPLLAKLDLLDRLDRAGRTMFPRKKPLVAARCSQTVIEKRHALHLNKSGEGGVVGGRVEPKRITTKTSFAIFFRGIAF